jgi:Ras and EF-hand domain-containing protein
VSIDVVLAGFGLFLGDQLGGGNENEQELIEHNPNDKEEQQLFHDTLDALGAKDLYDDEETIMGLWMKLRENDPTLLRQFEQFIGKITQEIRRSKLDHRSIEAALQSKSSVHESEIKKLYDEMEHQIKAEKAKVLAQVTNERVTRARVTPLLLLLLLLLFVFRCCSRRN